MYEFFRSPKTAGLIPASPVSLLFHHSPNLNVSCRQVCAVGLLNATSRRVIRDGLTLKFTFKLSQAAQRCWLHLHEGMPDSAAH